METKRHKVLIKTLNQLKLRKAMYKAFRVKASELPRATEVTWHMKKSPEETLVVIQTTMMHISNQKPSKHTGHHIISQNLELKQMLICFHCQNKGHYARNCHTKKKELKQQTATSTTICTTVTNDNRYQTLREENLDGPTSRPTYAPSHLMLRSNSLKTQLA
jgi:hypothetical protein